MYIRRSSALIAALFLALPVAAQQPAPAKGPPPPPASVAPAPAPGPGPAPAPSGEAAPSQPVALPDWFAEMDANKNGVVERSEFTAHRMKLFDQLDADANGTLTKAEFLKLADPPFSQDGPGVPSRDERVKIQDMQFEQLDTDKNGLVTKAEIEAAISVNFRVFDLNVDGILTPEEVRAVVVQTQARDRARERQQQQVQAQQGGGPGTGWPPGMDKNGDGLVDLAEFVDWQWGEFAARMDPNKDGKVSLQEYVVLAGNPNDPVPAGGPNYQQRREIVTKRFQALDGNRDGFIDKKELEVVLLPMFKQWDKNGDGKLTPQEAQAAQQANAPPPPPAPQQQQPPPQPRPAPQAAPQQQQQRPAQSQTPPAPRPLPPPPPPPVSGGGLQPGAPPSR